MNSALALLVQVSVRAVSIVMDTSELQETALSQGMCVPHEGRENYSEFNYSLN